MGHHRIDRGVLRRRLVQVCRYVDALAPDQLRDAEGNLFGESSVLPSRVGAVEVSRLASAEDLA